MYRICPDCNNGHGSRLAPEQVACQQEHDDVLCLLEVGDVVGDFQIEEVLPAGEGGYATVYRARPRVPDYPKTVALKVASMMRRAALEQEANALSALCLSGGSKHLLQIYPIASTYQAPSITGKPGVTNQYIGRAIVDLEPFYYLALEYLPGSSLRDELERRPGKGLGLGPTLHVARQVADALDHIHSCGMIHLDVKPSNIMFNAQGEAVLIDFGIAVHQEGENESWPGTAPYAPREQINQDYPDHRADIHALGVTIFEMLTGRLPYSGASATALSSAVRHSHPLSLAQVSPGLAYLDPALQRALEPEPTDRYNVVSEFIEALDAVSVKPQGRRLPFLGKWAIASALSLVILMFTLGAISATTNHGGVTSADTSTPENAATVAPSSTTGAISEPSAPAVELQQPAKDKVFEPGAEIVLSWRDPLGGLGHEKLYIIEVLPPDGKVIIRTTRATQYRLLPGSLYISQEPGVFRWQVYRGSIGKDGGTQPTSEASQMWSFTWRASAPSSTPTETPPNAQPTHEQITPTSTYAPPRPTRIPRKLTTTPVPTRTSNPLPPASPTRLTLYMPVIDMMATASRATATKPQNSPPTSTSVPPTRTPVPTVTSAPPTDTPVATDTPAIADADTPVPPTDVPEPTDAPVKVKTRTPVHPTNTHVPTAGPLKVKTATPTRTR